MSGHKSHKHSRDKDGDGEHKRSRHGPGHGRDGPREVRDREPRGPAWREAEARTHEIGREGRSGPPAGTGRGTPPKPPAPSRTGGPVLGNSALSSAIMEAAKRRAQEQAAAAAGSDEDGEIPAARKRSRHDDGAAPEKSQPESLQDRLQREAAEFRQRSQQDLAAMAEQSNRPRHHRPHSRTGSPSSSSEHSGGSSPEEGQRRKRGARWQADDDEDDQQQSQQQKRSRQQQKRGVDDQEQPEQQQKKSRWVLDDQEEGQTGDGDEGDAALGMSVSAAVDQELEELNRRERAELEADVVSDDSGAAGMPAGLGIEEEQLVEGIPYEKNMLEESRRVEEYERLNRISEGTYGVVHRARCKATGKIFALKKLKLESFQDGFPQTSVRELNVLLSLHHPNIVNVSEVCVGARNEVYMVMEYVEHDLKFVLELQQKKKAAQFSIGQVKCIMKQLLEGVRYLHEHWVLHRDLKTSNLLYSNDGQLKICDMGLARQYGSPLRAFTPQVVTLWYRSIERLLGDPVYSTALDMWSVGCIMAELILCEPLFQGRGELDQIKRIFQLLGTPTEDNWPGWDKLPDSKNLQWKPQESQLHSKFPAKAFGIGQALLTDAGFDLLSRLLEMNPAKRISAEDALKHPWFEESPKPVGSALMPSFPARHAQGAGKDLVRDKVAKPSPGAVLPAGFGL